MVKWSWRCHHSSPPVTMQCLVQGCGMPHAFPPYCLLNSLGKRQRKEMEIHGLRPFREDPRVRKLHPCKACMWMFIAVSTLRESTIVICKNGESQVPYAEDKKQRQKATFSRMPSIWHLGKRQNHRATEQSWDSMGWREDLSTKGQHKRFWGDEMVLRPDCDSDKWFLSKLTGWCKKSSEFDCI